MGGSTQGAGAATTAPAPRRLRVPAPHRRRLRGGCAAGFRRNCLLPHPQVLAGAQPLRRFQLPGLVALGAVRGRPDLRAPQSVRGAAVRLRHRADVDDRDAARGPRGRRPRAYITDVAPLRLRKPLAYVVDLFAAVPSVVYGFWGIFALLPVLHPIADHLTNWLGGIPGSARSSPARSSARPTSPRASCSRSWCSRSSPRSAARSSRVAPVAEKEAALALGATRWEMLRMSVLKRSTAGIFGASLLGLGRAFGETIAVTMLISTARRDHHEHLRPGRDDAERDRQ